MQELRKVTTCSPEGNGIKGSGKRRKDAPGITFVYAEINNADTRESLRSSSKDCRNELCHVPIHRKTVNHGYEWMIQRKESWSLIPLLGTKGHSHNGKVME
jgi:hypothetical protein